MAKKAEVSATTAKAFIKSIDKLPLSQQRKIIAPLEQLLKTPKTKAIKDIALIHEYSQNISNGPRLVTHIDEDGLVSAVIMCAVNPDKYVEIIYTEYNAINDGKFTFLPSDDVVDLPQPRNPKLDKEGNPLRNDSGVIFEEIVTNFWADHHETGDRGEYPGDHVYDPKSPSCASLLYNHFLQKEPTLKRFKELIDATDMVDSASYKTPDDPYNLDNPAVLLRLMLTNSRRQKDLSPGFRERLIREIADKKNDSWEKVRKALYNPVVVAIAKDALAEFEIYREYIRPFIKSEHGVTTKIEDEKRPFNLGIKDRFYPQKLYPDNLFLLECWKNLDSSYSISISENPFSKDKQGKSLSQLLLGEELQKIVLKFTGSPDAGGHKGIGMYQKLQPDKRDAVISACKELLFEETKRLGRY